MDKSNYAGIIAKTDAIIAKLVLAYNIDEQKAILNAYALSKEAHKDQVRKYTGEPYIIHPVDVAVTLRNYLGNKATASMISATLMHDVVEDTEVSFNTIAKQFDKETVHIVSGLTSASKWLVNFNRSKRKSIDKAFFKFTGWEIQSIKCADIIDNLRTILIYDKGFAVTYLKEKKDLVEVLHLADQDILNALYKVIEDGCDAIGIS